MTCFFLLLHPFGCRQIRGLFSPPALISVRESTACGNRCPLVPTRCRQICEDGLCPRKCRLYAECKSKMYLWNEINDIIVNILNWIISVWWYWLPAGIGFLFKYGRPEYRWMDWKSCLKKIIRDASIIFILTILLNELSNKELEDSVAVMIITLFFVYIFYGIAKECEPTGGTTESILLIIKSVFVTVLSFQDLGGAIGGAILTVFFAVIAYKFWISNEKKTDLFEIIFLCIETVVLSIVVEVIGIDGILIFLFIFYEETAIYFLNCIVKNCTYYFFDEQED